MKKIDEKELHLIFNEFKNKNQKAYNELYEKYYKLVYGIAFSVLKNKEDSEDITSEVFTKIYKMDKEKLPVSNEASWLFTVTRNECFSYLRKSRINISIDEIYDIPSDSKEMQEIVDTEYYNKLISGLSEQEKTIVSLKIISNFTFSKISQIMNIPIGTVQWKYYKAMNSLKISIGGLAGAIVAFILVFAGKDKFNKKTYLNENKNNSNVYNAEEIRNNENNQSEDSASSTKDIEGESQISSMPSNMEDKTSENSGKNTQEITSSTSNKGEISYTDMYPQTTTTFKEDAVSKQIKDNINVFNISLITIGIVSFIIFVIFFKKHQQKLHKKTSK